MLKIQERGKGFAILIVSSALVAFAIFYWYLRVDDRGEGAYQHAEADRRHAPVSSASARLSDSSSSASEKGLQQSTPQARRLAPPEEFPGRPNKTIAESDTSLPSVTHRYKAPAGQEHEADRPKSEHEAEIGDAETAFVKRVKLIELHTDSEGCEACWNSSRGGITIPQGCTYISHTLTQLHREPFAPIEQLRDENTEYLDGLNTDPKGQLKAITLFVKVQKRRLSGVNPSITMRLTVLMSCPPNSVGEE